MKKVKAKCGCEGCIFEHEQDCPGFDSSSKPLEACSENGIAMIFIKEEGDSDE